MMMVILEMKMMVRGVDEDGDDHGEEGYGGSDGGN